MKSRFVSLTALAVMTAFIGAPASLHGLTQAEAAQHEQHHADAAATPGAATAAEPHGKEMMAAMMATDAKLDALVTKMNAAKGTEKTEAMAELLTAIVGEHKAMSTSMMSMMPKMASMMNMMGGGMAHGEASPTPATPPPAK